MKDGNEASLKWPKVKDFSFLRNAVFFDENGIIPEEVILKRMNDPKKKKERERQKLEFWKKLKSMEKETKYI